MAVELTSEQLAVTSSRLSENEASRVINASVADTINTSHEYELNNSESLTFLYNLLYDDNSSLTKSDILSILNSLKERENNLPFSLTERKEYTNVQGVRLPPSLSRKFYLERSRIGNLSWFRNIPDSREHALNSVNIVSFNTKTNFFRFKNFYSRLKSHITHFQLRSLVVCGENISNGVFYPSSYYHDHNLEVVTSDNFGTHTHSDDHHNFFKIIRVMPDEQALSPDAMKLDCLIDSRTLKHHSNNRISSSACSSKFLVNGTFEGGYILQNIEDPDNHYLVGEYFLTTAADGITNHVSISKDDSELIIASNDAHIRFVDLSSSKITQFQLPFAVNCLAINHHNPNEYFIAADDTNNFIIDRRAMTSESIDSFTSFRGHTDYGFGCDWSPTDENMLLSGNQDGTVRLWDRRMSHNCLFSWSSALGSSAYDVASEACGGPVRNCKFSYYGKHVVWAESLDHVGVLKVDDLHSDCDLVLPRVQSIDFIGKCIGLNMCPVDSGQGEQLVIGVNDCPLGGILNYELEDSRKTLDFAFQF